MAEKKVNWLPFQFNDNQNRIFNCTEVIFQVFDEGRVIINNSFTLDVNNPRINLKCLDGEIDTTTYSFSFPDKVAFPDTYLQGWYKQTVDEAK